MKRKFQYSIREMTIRLLKIAAPVKAPLAAAAIASIVGNLSHMGLMGFGALWILDVYKRQILNGLRISTGPITINM